MAYRLGVLRQVVLGVPVVVVGNITVGGSGKTPLVAALAVAMRKAGRHPGIIARGHLGSERIPAEVGFDADPRRFGDEPVLLARVGYCPVVIGRDRVAAAHFLLQSHPDCDVLIADDGLQHYRLARNAEIAVFDRRGVMNGWLLPAGPLREPVSRLAGVDAIVVNGTAVVPAPTFRRPVFEMHLSPGRFYRLGDPATSCGPEEFVGRRLGAIAAIGDPQRFFEQLRGLGLAFEEHPFPDHHFFSAEDLALRADALLVTEKDAVKLEKLDLSVPVWVLPVTALVTPDLATFVLETIDGLAPA